MDLRLPVDAMVTASDASLHAGAVVASQALTPYGLERIAELQRPVHLHSCIGIVAINDCLGSAYRAAELVRCQLAFFAHWNWHGTNELVLQYSCGHFLRLSSLTQTEIRMVRQVGTSVT
eukprot:1976251-Amphidinium_carterae.1